MNLKRLALHNYKQHADIAVEFDGNIIGVVGPNGSGKSNLLGAVHFAFAGEQPGFKKGDLLKWGEVEGNVTLEFEALNGTKGKITRQLHSNGASFKFGDDSYSGITKVGNALELVLGMDKDLLRQAIFVPQGLIDAILFTDPRVRELSFQRMCGIGDASKIHKKLGEHLSSLQRPPNYDQQIVDKKTEYEGLRQRLNQLKATLDEQRKQRESYPQLTELRASKASFDTSCNIVSQLSTIHDEDVRLTNTNSVHQHTLDGLNIPENITVAQLDAEIEKTQKILRAADEYRAKFVDWENRGKEIIELGNEPELAALPYSNEQVDELQSIARELLAKYNVERGKLNMFTTLKDAITGMDTIVECPLCGSSINDVNALRTRLDGMLTDGENKLKQVSPIAAQQTAKNAELETARCTTENERQANVYQTKHAILVEQYNKADSILKTVEKVEQDIPALQQTLQQLKKQQSDLMRKNVEWLRLTTIIKENQKRLNTLADDANELQRVWADIASRYDELGVDKCIEHFKTKSSEFDRLLDDVQELEQQLSRVTGVTEELENNLNGVGKTIAVLEEERSKQTEYAAALKILTEVRDWFHYSNGPHTLSTSVLAEMTNDINRFLDRFGASFTVLPSDELLGFKCLFHDGRAAPADGPPDALHLSGGQKIQLATSFRFASYCMFANKQGLLSLDEPTIYLDDANIGRFCALVEQIREVAKQMKLQILIATHEKAVTPFFDTVINLDKEQIK